MILNTPEQIDAFRLITIWGALRLELMGMKRRGRSAYSIVKEEFGLKGNKHKVFDQFTDILKENNIMRD
tara:strand:- start:774 stop:980 length:207 start_codon:yes stop_codon:yes gene_type:complete